METWITKVISLLLIFIITLFFGLLPIKLVRILRPRNRAGVTTGSEHRADVIISFLNCFSGGVFLAITMLDLLPEVREQVESVLVDLKQDSKFPLTEFIACLGFFIVMLLENSVVQYQRQRSLVSAHRKSLLQNATSWSRGGGEVQEEAPLLPDSTINRPNRSTSSVFSQSSSVHGVNGKVDHQHEDRMLVGPANRGETNHPTYATTSCGGGGGGVSRNIHESFYHSLTVYGSDHHTRLGSCHSRDVTRQDGTETHVVFPHYGTGNQAYRNRENVAEEVHTPSAHGHSHGFDPEEGSLHSLRSLVLLIALSTHTVFEGMALGLQPTSLQVWTLFTAIILHKAIMAFTAGLRFVETLRKIQTTVVYIVIFSLTAPVGIAIGLVVSESGTSGLAKDIVSAVLQGVATGTFIYVTFFEVLIDEMTNRQSIAKVLAAILGFACITVLCLVEGMLVS